MRVYKTLSSADANSLNIKLTRDYFYVIDGESKAIKEDRFDNSSNEKLFQLIDEEYEWDPKTQPIHMNILLTLDNASSLFGPNGICCDDAVIGVGLTWKPNKSKIKHCVKIGDFKKGNTDVSLEAKNILIENAGSNISFTLVFYISKPGSSGTFPSIANEQGLIVFERKEWTLVVEGEGSLFPVHDYCDPDGPLWTYKCEVTDLKEDEFDEQHIEIRLNKAHKNYCFIDHKSQLFSSVFLNEIFSSALAAIIIDIHKQTNNDQIEFDEENHGNCIFSVLRYFAKNLKIQINGDYTEIYKSVKMYFDKESNL